MKFTTQLELNITVKSPEAIYATDYDQMLLDHARIMYEKKCRDGQYIQSIDRLVERSLANLIKRDLTTKVRVYIKVNVSAIRYDKTDIITGMRVCKIIDSGKINNMNMVHCTNDHVLCILRLSADASQFKVGDIIPIRVRQSLYKIGNSSILVDGFPFIAHVPQPMVYYNIGKLTADVKTHFESMIAPMFDREMARKESLDAKRWQQFADMLVPYKKPAKSVKGATDITDISLLQNKNVAIDYSVDLTKLKVLAVSHSDTTQDMIVENEDSKNAITKIAYEYVKLLTVINDLTEQCAADEEYDKLAYVWKMYEESKL